jgi:hypothetical protein
LPRRSRRQRVILRPKQKIELQRQLRRVILGGVLIGGLATVSWQAISHPATWAPRYIQTHTPTLELQAPETLSTLPLLKQPPSGSFALWFPGPDARIGRKWVKENPAIAGVSFDKRFAENRVIARLEPRVPLAQWDGHALDKEGKIFPLLSNQWTPLPKGFFTASTRLPAIGRWLAEVARQPDVWNQVLAVSQDPRGDMWLEMQHGTRVAWGAPDIRLAPKKAKCLSLVLNDAHQRLSGAASADLRFFEEGRVIVRPKTAI